MPRGVYVHHPRSYYLKHPTQAQSKAAAKAAAAATTKSGKPGVYRAVRGHLAHGATVDPWKNKAHKKV